MNYPNKGKSSFGENEIVEEKPTQFANRGMDFEHAVSSSCAYYDDQKRAIITKRPTPIHIVKVDYKAGGRIKDAYFEKQSTADYNGVYRGKYVDFECKETRSSTSFPFHNIASHQVDHLEKVLYHGGIAFFLIYFVSLGEVYLVDASIIIDRFRHSERKSMTLDDIKKHGALVEQGFIPRLNFLDAVDKTYFG